MLRLLTLFACQAVIVAITFNKANAPTYAETVACSKKVSDLSDETRRLLDDNQEVDRACTKSLDYYTKMISLVEQSISHLENQVSSKDGTAEMKENYRERYTNIMCGKCHDAFFLKDDDSRTEVLHICIGRKSVAPSSLLKRQADLDKKQCPQEGPMQQRVQELRTAKAVKVAECKTKKQALINELDQKRKEEDELEEQYYGHYQNKDAIRTEVASEVETEFCNVINENYHLKEENIQDFW
eukprot:CAMPEP_0169114946 /NCGR_PEP_ID=MMETSP1015-20121227/29062_1 /TAXON_ID=342587 /ORGANISM="Karlodinium micrum, Strain CCMP2283" /LENGTH=240 /DNA_ID=CAMNT_0009177329 /DNA_START=89 /DNA_END=808 /DNA_ORIENTATION=-